MRLFLFLRSGLFFLVASCVRVLPNQESGVYINFPGKRGRVAGAPLKSGGALLPIDDLGVLDVCSAIPSLDYTHNPASPLPTQKTKRRRAVGKLFWAKKRRRRGGSRDGPKLCHGARRLYDPSREAKTYT